MTRIPVLLAAAIPTLAACAIGVPTSDAPVPAAEPRALVRLHVDLPRAHDCEEAFDLALYRSRAVDLVTWDPAGERCQARTVTIRYLAKQASRDDVVRAASAAAAKVDVLPSTPSTPSPSTNGDSR